MKKLKIINILKHLLKIIIIILILYTTKINCSHYGKPLDATNFTGIGINSIFEINPKGETVIGYGKVISNSVMILAIYFFILLKIHNYYEGLKETIRIKSKNLNDYLLKCMQFVLPTILKEMITFIILILIFINVMSIDGIYKIEVIKNLFFMFVFYTLLPISLMFMIEKFEIYLAMLFIMSLLAPVFIYKFDIFITLLCYLVVLLLIYLSIRIKENKA